jgi:hypothetical protein
LVIIIDRSSCSGFSLNVHVVSLVANHYAENGARSGLAMSASVASPVEIPIAICARGFSGAKTGAERTVHYPRNSFRPSNFEGIVSISMSSMFSGVRIPYAEVNALEEIEMNDLHRPLGWRGRRVMETVGLAGRGNSAVTGIGRGLEIDKEARSTAWSATELAAYADGILATEVRRAVTSRISSKMALGSAGRSTMTQY